jgi:uncharacterized protein (DUF1330 family)
MSAYLIFTRISTKNQAELVAYGKLAGPSLQGHQVTPIIRYGDQEILEGSNHEGMVVLSFPTRAEAKAWYDSPAYVVARDLRQKGAEYQVTLVDGV